MENARLITETREALSSRPRPPRCCGSSIPRPAISRRCSMRCSKRRRRLCEADHAASCDLRWRVLSASRSRRRHRPSIARMSDADAGPLGPDPGTVGAAGRRASASSISSMSRPIRRYTLEDRCRRSGSAVRAPCSSCRCCARTSAARRHRCLPPGGAAVHRQADRAAAELRRAGGHRDGERAAHHRDARGAGAADRDRRGVAGHQLLARRPRAGIRCDAGEGARVCASADFGMLGLTMASAFSAVADAWRRQTRYATDRAQRIGPGPHRDAPLGRMLDGERFVHIADLRGDDALSSRRSRAAEHASSSAASAPCLSCRCARTTRSLGVIIDLPPGGPAVHRQADRAACRTSPRRR